MFRMLLLATTAVGAVAAVALVDQDPPETQRVNHPLELDLDSDSVFVVQQAVESNTAYDGKPLLSDGLDQ